MSVLSWDKPKKTKTTEEWKNDVGFDGGPAGGYQSNMSDDDKAKWKAKLTGTKLGYPQVEIRKEFRSAQLLVIVNLGAGYNYKYYRTDNDRQSYPTRGVNVHMSMNGPAQLTFAEMEELQQAVAEAKYYLEQQATLSAGIAEAKAVLEQRNKK